MTGPDFVTPQVVHDAPITLADPDPAWADVFATEAARLRGVLGERALAVEHVGSTSVPGLAAKPIVDMILVVADTADEPAYVPDVEAAGYVLHIREPDWFEHRLFQGVNINLHVFPDGCTEVGRMLAFRDHLRADDADRRRYEDAKRALAVRHWWYVQDYADAKSDVVAEIMERALG